MTSSNPPPSVVIEAGTRLDRYELLALLAHGGMANVWLSRVQGKLKFEKLLAIKTIIPNEAENASFREMFFDEARIASRIDHPSVVRILDVGDYQGVPYLVMDLIEGEPLHKLTRGTAKRGERIPLKIALRIMADACQGLHAAHELRDDAGTPLSVVHRDVSPQNIIVTTSGVAKVIDFGIAKALDRSSQQTTAGTLKGKISYMPREQALGKDVDRRADTWALGAVLYYLLTGQPPYKGETQLATLQLAMNGDPIPPLPPTVPPAVRKLVTRALTQQIEQRFQTAAQMATAIEDVIRELGSSVQHSDVAQFVQSVMGEKIEARRALVAKALAEAENRRQVRSQPTIPIEVELGDTDASNPGGLLDLRANRTDASGSLQIAQIDGPPPGTLGATTFEVTRGRASVAAKVALGAFMLLGVVGAVLIVRSVGETRRLAAGAQASAAATSAAPPPIPAPAPPREEPVASASAQADAKRGAAADGSAATAGSAAPSSSAAQREPPRGAPAAPPWAAAKPVVPPKPAGAGNTSSKGRKRDDEAGF